MEYFKRHKINYFDYSFFFVDSLADSLSTHKYALNTWKLENRTNASPIQLRVYDSRGKLINGYSQCFGNFKKLNILKDTNLVYYNHLPINNKLNFDDDLFFIKAPDSIKEKLNENCGYYKYTIVFYWNIWSNYYSKVIFKELKNFKDKINEEKIRIILINTGIDEKPNS
jgi:hypothetical protein